MIKTKEKNVQMPTFRAPESIDEYVKSHCKKKGDYTEVMVHLLKKGIEAQENE